MAPAPDKVHNLPLDRDSNKKKSKSDYQTQDDCPLPSGLKFKPYKLKLSVREYQKRQEILWFDNVEGNSATSQSHTQFTKYYNLKNGYSVASPALREPGCWHWRNVWNCNPDFPRCWGILWVLYRHGIKTPKRSERGGPGCLARQAAPTG